VATSLRPPKNQTTEERPRTARDSCDSMQSTPPPQQRHTVFCSLQCDDVALIFSHRRAAPDLAPAESCVGLESCQATVTSWPSLLLACPGAALPPRLRTRERLDDKLCLAERCRRARTRRGTTRGAGPPPASVRPSRPYNEVCAAQRLGTDDTPRSCLKSLIKNSAMRPCPASAARPPDIPDRKPSWGGRGPIQSSHQPVDGAT